VFSWLGGKKSVFGVDSSLKSKAKSKKNQFPMSMSYYEKPRLKPNRSFIVTRYIHYETYFLLFTCLTASSRQALDFILEF
jgi:hypothetical protein